MIGERVFTASEVIAALRQSRQDMDDCHEHGRFPVTDKEKLTAHVALAEAANYLGLAEEYDAHKWDTPREN